MMRKLFARLRKIREFERRELAFLKSFVDFDIVIEIGYAEEQKQPLTPKRLFLLKLGSLTTVRRRLAQLMARGIVAQRPAEYNRHAAMLTITPPARKLLRNYGKVLTAISTQS